MTWIYRTTKKNDRMDARKMAVLLSIGEIPAVHMTSKVLWTPYGEQDTCIVLWTPYGV